MIKLTRKESQKSSEPFYVNPDKINSVYHGDGFDTQVYVNEVVYGVVESVDTVFRLITEYKQRQMRLQAAYNARYSHVDVYQLGSRIVELESEDRGE